MAKIQISMSDISLKNIDSYAESNGLSRSGLMTMATLEYINARSKASKAADSAAEFANIVADLVAGRINKSAAMDKLSSVEADIKSLTVEPSMFNPDEE